MKLLSSVLFAASALATTAFTSQPTIQTWGVVNSKSAASTRLFQADGPVIDTDFEGVDIVRLLGLNSVNKLVKKSQRSKGPLKLIIAGAPASGKGTQCELIKKQYGVTHLSTGDMLRAAVVAGSEVGTLAKEYMDAGKLVPDEVIIGVVKDRLNEDDCKSNGWLLDGFPRTPAQAEALAVEGIKADCFLFLNVPDEMLVERVVGRRTDPETGKIYHMTFSPPDDEEILARLEQRSDDTEEKVKVRLEQFHANVEAVKGSYEEIGIDIDGTAKPDEVAKAVKAAIQSKVGV